MNSTIVQVSSDGIKFDDDNLKNYDIRKMVGEGEFCKVYKAIHRPDGRTVAVKRLQMERTLNGQTRLECLREIQVLRHLNHPNIIKHFESFYARNELFIVLEYADAGDLSKMLNYLRQNNKFLGDKAIQDFFQQICNGLEHMHSKCIMHRDLKPANVLLKRDRQVKLGDFGFSRLLSSASKNAQTLVGTPYYMAPERMDQLEYSFPADIWSLGCVLYEMITLYTPFFEQDLDLITLTQKIQRLDYRPIPIRHGSNGSWMLLMHSIIQGCLLLNPTQRFDIKQIQVIIKQCNRNG